MRTNAPPHIQYNCGFTIAFIIAMSVSFVAYAVTGEYGNSDSPSWVPGEVIVKFSAEGLKTNGLSPNEVIVEVISLGIEDKYGVYDAERIYSDELLFPETPINHPKGVWTWEDWQDSVAEFELDTYYLIKYSGNYEPPEVAAAYNAMDSVDIASPNYLQYYCDYLPNDPYLSEQYHLHNTGQNGGVAGADLECHNAWWYWQCKTAIPSLAKPILAIIDSGVKMNHPDLIDNRVDGFDFVERDDYPNDVDGHGTAVSGVACATTHNANYVASVSWNKINYMPLKAGDTEGLPTSYIIQAILHAVSEGADAINMSFGWYERDAHMEVACRFAYANGIVNVASKGNFTPPDYERTDHHYPSDFATVIAVSGTDHKDKLWYNSNYGENTEIAAPGYKISTTRRDFPFYFEWDTAHSGTSFSAPMVSAACTLIADAIGPTTPPEDRVVQTRTILHACVEDINYREYPGWDEQIGHGRLNLYYVALYIDSLNKGKVSSETATDIREVSKTPILSVPSPNPVKDTATFSFVVPGGYTGPGCLEVYDIKGRKVESVYFAVSGLEDTVELDAGVSSLSPGVYIGRIKTDIYSSPVKFVVEP